MVLGAGSCCLRGAFLCLGVFPVLVSVPFSFAGVFAGASDVVCFVVFRGFPFSCRPSRVSAVVALLRASLRRRRALVSAPVWSASFAGSALFLSSPAFLSFVAGGGCPVSLVLRVFSWPVRSAVFLVLLRVCSCRAVLASVPRGLLVAFARVALASLGFRGGSASSFLGGFSWPRVPSFSGVCSSRSVGSAFSSLCSCLSWLLSSRGGRRGCPSACRGALAGLVAVVLRFLAS